MIHIQSRYNLRKLRQKELNFEPYLGILANPYLKAKNSKRLGNQTQWHRENEAEDHPDFKANLSSIVS